jgi:hypothetical protein
MTRHCVVLLSLAFLSAQAETLSLSNGTSVTGRLISIEKAQIRFQVNGSILAYPRSDVTGIDFGPEPTQTAQAPLPPVNGQTIDQVLAQLGQPEVIADGEERIYIYRQWKIVFIGSKVANVEGTTPGIGRLTTGAASRLALGQRTDDIVAVLGDPVNIVDLGPKKIYVFKDLKVTFQDGKVTGFKITTL